MSKRALSACLTWLLFASLINTTTAQTADKTNPLSAEEIAGLVAHLRPPMAALSPDGQLLAYTLRDTKRIRLGDPSQATSIYNKGTDVWITYTRTGESKSLTQAVGNNWCGVWSPDGNSLAFFSDRDGDIRLWVWKRDSAQIIRVSPEKVAPLVNWELPVWLPDSSGLIVRVPSKVLSQPSTPVADHANASTSDRPNIIVFDSPRSETPKETGPPRANVSDLALVDVKSGTLRSLATNVGYGLWRVSPDGKYIAVTSQGEQIPDKFMFHNQLFIVSLTDGSARILADDIRQEQPAGSWFSWSPDSKQIAYTDIGSQTFKNSGQTRGELHVTSLSDSTSWSTSNLSHPSFGDDWRAPLWNPNGTEIFLIADGALWKIDVTARSASEVARIPLRRIQEIFATPTRQGYWSLDHGRTMTVLTRESQTMKDGFYSIDVSTGAQRQLRETRENLGSSPQTYSIAASSDGSVVVYMSQAADRFENFWLTDSSFRSVKQLTHVNSVLEGRPLGISRMVEWRSPRGELLHGALLLPPGYVEGRKVPLIVNVYGGIFPSRYINRFGIDVDMMPPGIGAFLATRGYAVFRPDTPLRIGTPMVDLAEAVLSGIDEVVRLGIADPDRLGVIGHSYGGYGTLAMIVQTNRFKAAIVNQGLGDLINFCYQVAPSGNSNSGTCEDGQIRMGAILWEDRQRFINNSPIFFLDRVRTPLLFANGANDRWSPPAAAEQIFGALSRLGRRVQYVKYLDEGHNFLLYRDNVDFLQRMDAWFKQYIPEQK
ncbi:MAG TPA: prolyl oligopeptidase family serine peptidase [Pyrinomonadaceae bacterium]|nr:prolyl oligopeptidase family serine peptidase [Pyrinomonadaceae bacterium]